MRFRTAVAVLAGIGLLAIAPVYPQALGPQDFRTVVPQGFGDRQNSLAWSMTWWPSRKKLFVGTGRATACTAQAALELSRPRIGAYPPADPDIECTPDARDLPLSGEIWSWSADTDTWKLAYRSPNDVAIPAYPGKFVARDIGFRDMLVLTERDGTEALYVSGVSARAFDEESVERYLTDPQLPPPRILRSVDGETFAPVPSEPGTIWHRHNPLDGFRTLSSYNDRLYVIASVGPLGHGFLFESDDPAHGNDSFRKIQVTPGDLTIFEMATYNGALYVGTGGQPLQNAPPFTVWKTTASGSIPYTFTPVIPPGAFHPSDPSVAAISMFVFGGRLYVGTERELLRVNPDDTWEVVVGAPRATPSGPLAPLSGLGDGFGNRFNIHVWRMAEHRRTLYVGTDDLATKYHHAVGANALIGPDMGFDLFATDDGWYFTRITRIGFSEPGRDNALNQGVRNLVSTPAGLFLGAANHFFGLNVWRGDEGPPAPAAPQRLEADADDASVVLSWDASPGDGPFHVFRDTTSSRSREIVAGRPRFLDGTWAVVDSHARAEASYSYQVVAVDDGGRSSSASNVAASPSQAMPVDFASLEAALLRWRAPLGWIAQLKLAESQSRSGAYGESRRGLRRLLSIVEVDAIDAGAQIPSWRRDDAQVLLRKLIRRVSLVEMGLLSPDAL
jgi:hypothetical protein